MPNPKRNPRRWRKTTPTGVHEKYAFCSIETEGLIRKMFIEELHTAKNISKTLNFPSEKSVLAILLRLGATYKSMGRSMKDVWFIRSRHDEYLRACEDLGYEKAYDLFCQKRQQSIIDAKERENKIELERQKRIQALINDDSIVRNVKIMKLRDLKMSLKDIGSIYKITKERVRQIEQAQRDKLNNPVKTKEKRSDVEILISKYSLSTAMQETIMGNYKRNKVNGNIKSLTYLKKKGLCDLSSDEVVLTDEGQAVKQAIIGAKQHKLTAKDG